MMCACGHSFTVHVAYIGGCGLCSCVAFQRPSIRFSISVLPNLSDDTKEADRG